MLDSQAAFRNAWVSSGDSALAFALWTCRTGSRIEPIDVLPEDGADALDGYLNDSLASNGEND